MPTPATTDLPIPKSWDEFEDISADLLMRKWRDPYVIRNGRTGQKQNGVDIYGKPAHLRGVGAELAGAQCKRVESMTEEQVRAEVESALGFEPKLEEYLLLTSLKRDATLQKFVRTTTWKIDRVEIFFWEDLSLQITEYNELLKKHFPGWFKQTTSKGNLIQALVTSNPDDYVYDDSTGVHLLQSDVGFSLRLDRPEEYQTFEEPWVSNFPDKNASCQEVYLEYNGARIETFFFASVDGARYLVPYPKSATDLRISRFHYHLARILNAHSIGYDIDHALAIARIEIDPSL
ncbi:hypothetical protein Q31b_00990 [Novipirellula aureliae]|uniref:Restriction endonuclease type IV Mrr domain-containing protein n=1 Tax=Novipirellula aureliae TaxID=2527966 RepID=A0A5C6E7Y4_9BACT|nr:hypothetical protein [Novipirellula aureliae]TWU44928.1 hypothetical protein Q31b_00990 [Novipirellula aureliae]